MKTTSDAQRDAFESKTTPGFEQIRDDVWSMGMALPSVHQPLYSFLYLLKDSDGGIHVIDTGMPVEENKERFTTALEGVGGELGDVRSIIVTHHHPDHLGIADWMREQTGAELLVHADEQDAIDGHRDSGMDRMIERFKEWGAPEGEAEKFAAVMDQAPRDSFALPTADRFIAEGELLPIPGFQLRAIFTPGHTPGHIVLSDADRDILFTGDHILPTQFPGVAVASNGTEKRNPLADYLHSLEVMPKDPEVLPGHGYRFRGLQGRLEETAEHHMRRAREVSAVLDVLPGASVWEIASKLTWTAGFENLANFYLFSALMQTSMHRAYILDGGVVN